MLYFPKGQLEIITKFSDGCMETLMWVTIGITGLVNAFAFGSSLSAPYRLYEKHIKWIKDNPPPMPLPYPSNNTEKKE